MRHEEAGDGVEAGVDVLADLLQLLVLLVRHLQQALDVATAARRTIGVVLGELPVTDKQPQRLQGVGGGVNQTYIASTLESHSI